MAGEGDIMLDPLQLYNTITEIRVELGKLSTRLEKFDDFNRSMDDLKHQIREVGRRAEEVENLLGKTIESTKAAHHRLDGVTKIGYWLLTAFGGAAIVGVVGFALNGGFAPQ